VIERAGGRVVAIGRIDENAIKSAYRRWAPVYDNTFGRISADGRKAVVALINRRRGRVLEVGVGTGLSLSEYAPHLDIVGIDLSPEMLDKARQRVAMERLDNISGLHEMDASDLAFPDHSFDTTVAMFVMTVVPDPERVMRELARVTKPGGEVLLVNHFSQEEGVRGWVERQMAPFAEILGWRPVFDVGRVLVCEDLRLVQRRTLKPWRIFTIMRFAKRAAGEQTAVA
jgi:phosphatidylethanolamine/phosphatidyl-N-methylethanolamine N-methyltransferase